jgi:hypothetical protein
VFHSHGTQGPVRRLPSALSGKAFLSDYGKAKAHIFKKFIEREKACPEVKGRGTDGNAEQNRVPARLAHYYEHFAFAISASCSSPERKAGHIL